MNHKSFSKKNSTTILFLIIVIFTINIYGQKTEEKVKPCNKSNGRGFAGSKADYGLNMKPLPVKKAEKNSETRTRNLKIISKPIAKYTEEARANCIEGKVLLSITFFADGTVGKFKVIEGLKYGLSEQAIKAAKRIKFEPEMRKGKAITVTKKVSYNFTIY